MIQRRRIVVGAADAALRTKRQPGQQNLVPPEQQLKTFRIIVQTQLKIHQVLVSELDSGQHRNPLLRRLQKVEHREIDSGQRRNMVKIKRQLRRRFADLRHCIDELRNAARPEVVRRHRRDRVGPGRFGVSGEFLRLAHSVRTDVHDDRNPARRRLDERSRRGFALRRGHAGTLPGRTADEKPGQLLPDQIIRQRRNPLEIKLQIRLKRSVCRDDQSLEFHFIPPVFTVFQPGDSSACNKYRRRPGCPDARTSRR